MTEALEWQEVKLNVSLTSQVLSQLPVACVAKAKEEGEGGEKRKRGTWEEGREGSTCNQSPINTLLPTFQTHIIIASSVIDLSWRNL